MPNAAGLRRRLLRWYRGHRRDLPWRKTRDPYAIWVAEVMLQQTRSETVLGYFPRFLRRFPTIAALARAKESDVLARWSGLGYYSRARQLRRAARELVRRHRGRLPRDVAALRALPGVGRYTAGAIASIAFGVPAPLVDGNVARVLCRIFEMRGQRRSPLVEKQLWDLAERLLPRSQPGDWNQALMELGATLCSARAPACARCPVRRDCGAYKSGTVDRLPEPTPRLPTRRARRSCVVVEHGDQVLLARRDEGRLLRGLWEFPTPQALSTLAVGRWTAHPFGTILHTIMNQRIETRVFRARLRRRSRPASPSARWFRWRDVDRLPLSAVGLRIAARRTADLLSSSDRSAPRCRRRSGLAPRREIRGSVPR